MICWGLLIFMVCEPPKQSAVDSFCTTYQKQIKAKGDGAISAPLAVRQRIAANETTYRCLCENWQNPACKQ